MLFSFSSRSCRACAQETRTAATHTHKKHTHTAAAHAHKRHTHSCCACAQETHTDAAHAHKKHTHTAAADAHKRYTHSCCACAQETHTAAAHEHKKHTHSCRACDTLLLPELANGPHWAVASDAGGPHSSASPFAQLPRMRTRDTYSCRTCAQATHFFT
jgi:hypothetical protein